MGGFGDLSGEVTVLILGGGRGTRLAPLTKRRAKPAVPIGGKHRLIDIPISNAINSGMERMYVLTQFNSVSLHRHIARTYRFDAFSKGYVHILAAQQTPSAMSWFQGTADAVRQNLQLINDLQSKYVLILAGDHMYRMDYRELLKEHIDNDADITIGVMPCSEEEIGEFGAARVDPSGRIVEFREKPKNETERQGMEVAPDLLAAKGVRSDQPYLASMGIYIFRKEVLLEALENDFVDFGGEVIPSELHRRRIQAHFFKGYWRDIGTIRAFFEAHMDLVSEFPRFSFHDPRWPIYTRPRFLPGAMLSQCQFDQVLLADGSHLERATIAHSVIGIRSVVRGASLDRALLMGVDSHLQMPDAEQPSIGIGEGSVISNAIIDKNARIGRNVSIINARNVTNDDGDGWCIRDGITVISKNAVIPDGTVI